VTYKILSVLFVLPPSSNFYEQFVIGQPISIKLPYKVFNGRKFLVKSIKVADTIGLMGQAYQGGHKQTSDSIEPRSRLAAAACHP
jgi:hypothetical protein